MSEYKKLVSVVNTMGDWGGYQLYEWFKLFSEDRERSIREYLYLKAFLVRSVLKTLGKEMTLEQWNDFYLELGKEMEADPDFSYKANYEELCQALRAYEGLTPNQAKAVFARRAGIGDTVYSQQLVPQLTNFFSRTQAELRKSLR